MSVYHYAAPSPLQQFDGVRIRRILIDQERDLFEVQLVFVLGVGASAKDVQAKTESFAALGALAFLVANFQTLGGSTFYDKVLSALASPGIGRIPAGGTLV